MDNLKLRLTAGFLLSLSLSLNTCRCQQTVNSIFNQSPFQRRQQSLLRQQQQQQQQTFPGVSPFAPGVTPLNQLSPIVPVQSAYRSYNQLNSQNFIPITAYQNELNYDGSFAYGYSSADGTTAQAQGYVKNLGLGEAVEAQVVQGSYSYTSPEGTPITVRYIADENGFRAEGAHIPTPPPIPDAIAKSLLYSGVQQQQQQLQQQQQPFQQQSLNPNLNPYQTPFRQFNTPQTLRLGSTQQQQQQQQLTPLQLQQQRFYQQQQSGQYQPDNVFNQQQQRGFGVGNISAGQQLGSNFQQDQNQQQQPNLTGQRQQNILAQQQHQQQNVQQQSTQQQQDSQQSQSPQQQQLATQQLQGRPSQLVNPYGYNQYRRYKKAATKA